MTDLKRRFISIKEAHPEYGDVIIMWYAIKGMGYSREIIRKTFNVCVSQEEYDKEDKVEIINYLEKYSNAITGNK